MSLFDSKLMLPASISATKTVVRQHQSRGEDIGKVEHYIDAIGSDVVPSGKYQQMRTVGYLRLFPGHCSNLCTNIGIAYYEQLK